MQADLPDHCPECGSNWNARGGVAYGRLQRRPWVWMVGAAMVALGFALIMSPLARRGWQFRIMPTGSLIREITQAPRGFTVDEWAALRARTLSPSQREQLARGLLDKRLRKTFFSADADNWIVAQITAGTLAPALRDRYYAEAVDAWIIGPETARVGEAVTLALGTRLRHASTNNAKPLLLVGGYIVGEDAPPQSREDKALSASLVGQQRLHVADRDAGPGRSPECVITPREPGVITIHAPIWVIYAPGTTSMAITWQDDGTPTLPPGPVPFMETRVLEHRIVVTP